MKTSDIKIEDAYNPLGCPSFIDITVRLGDKTFNGLLEVQGD